MEKAILTTGGTGGHIFPAIAVAEELRKRNPHVQLLFIGSRYGPEARYAENNDIPFEGLPVRGFLGRGLRAVPAAFNMVSSIWKSRTLIKKFAPDVIAGFGGYASFAPMLAGHLLGVPILLHEQNAIAGTGNRILARFADRICVSLRNTQGFAKAARLTGNPVRSSIRETGAKRKKPGKPLHLFILGGSQGAHGINLFIEKILPELRKRDLEILHQCGKADLPMLREAYARNGFSPDCAVEFIEDMASAYQWADLAICRAGASTIAELCATSLPSLLIPFPAAIHDHQTRNAKNLADCGGAFIFQEKNLDPSGMLAVLDNLLHDDKRLLEMSAKTGSLNVPDAASLLVDQMEEIKRKK